MSDDHLIGRWSYHPQSNELRRGGEVVRLEERAARALDLLHERRGSVVSRAELVARVWNGRQVSDNSLPMVIGQLRRALGGGKIETIPKRGYRLVLAEASSSTTVRRWIAPAIAAVIALILAVAAFGLFRPNRPETIAVLPVGDETSDPRYAALARATDALLVAEVVERGFVVSRTASPEGTTLRGRLVIWEGQPFLALDALDRGTIVWSAMIGGRRGAIPREIDLELDRWFESRDD